MEARRLRQHGDDVDCADNPVRERLVRPFGNLNLCELA